MIPLFKSTFSIGKSILTLDDPEKDTYPNGPKSIFSIAKEESLRELFLVEDSFYSFYNAYKYCTKNDIRLFYGITFKFLEITDELSVPCKIVVFMKNAVGYADLINLNAIASTKEYLLSEDLDKNMTPNLQMAIPFYDSFVFMNTLSFGKFSDFILKFKPIFFIEEHGLPFDDIVNDSVKSIAGDKFPLVLAHTILYYNRVDVEAFLTYKCICNREFGKKSLSKPNFDHFCSDSFCWESFKCLTNH